MRTDFCAQEHFILYFLLSHWHGKCLICCGGSVNFWVSPSWKVIHYLQDSCKKFAKHIYRARIFQDNALLARLLQGNKIRTNSCKNLASNAFRLLKFFQVLQFCLKLKKKTRSAEKHWERALTTLRTWVKKTTWEITEFIWKVTEDCRLLTQWNTRKLREKLPCFSFGE